MGNVPKELRGTDDLLRRWPALLPPRRRRRLTLHRRHVRQACNFAFARWLVSQIERSQRSRVINFMWGEPPSAVHLARQRVARSFGDKILGGAALFSAAIHSLKESGL